MNVTAPPKCAGMAARKARLEADRERLFPIWKAALEKAGGNITIAAEQSTPVLTRNQANKLTHRLGLVEYAAELRRKMTGRDRGNPNRGPQTKKNRPSQ